MENILVVDDELGARNAISSLLSGEGFKVYRARSGKEAISKRRAYSPSAVLLDMRMPEMDGLETARRIRTEDPSVPLIAVTAFPKDYEPNSDIEFFDWVHKPVVSKKRRTALVQRVREAISVTNANLLNDVVGRFIENFEDGEVKKLIGTVSKLSSRIMSPKTGTFAEDLAQNRDVAKLALMFGTAQILKETDVGLELFSKVFFSEIQRANILSDTLRKVNVTRLADKYEQDMKELMEIGKDLGV